MAIRAEPSAPGTGAKLKRAVWAHFLTGPRIPNWGCTVPERGQFLIYFDDEGEEVARFGMRDYGDFLAFNIQPPKGKARVSKKTREQCEALLLEVLNERFPKEIKKAQIKDGTRRRGRSA